MVLPCCVPEPYCLACVSCCRERGAKALEERLGLKAAASGGAPAGTAQVAAKPDVESGEAPGAATGAAS